MRKAGTFLSKQGHLQPHFHSKARQLSKNAQNDKDRNLKKLVIVVKLNCDIFQNFSHFFCNAHSSSIKAEFLGYSLSWLIRNVTAFESSTKIHFQSVMT